MDCSHDITQNKILKKVKQQLKTYFPDIHFIINPISRIFTNNVVYKVTGIENGLCLSVKVYLNINNVKCRFDTERKFTNDYFREIHNLTNNFFISLCDNDIYGILIRKWIEGQSAMNILLNNPEQFMEKEAGKIVHLMMKVWNYKEKSEPYQFLLRGADSFNFQEHYIMVSIKKILNQCDHLLLKRKTVEKLVVELKKEVISVFRNYNLEDTSLTIINGDPSLYEFFFNEDKIIWIDWEYVRLGNKFIDIASFYYSVINNLWENEYLIEICLKVLVNELGIADKRLFGLFLLEKVITCDEITDCVEPIEKLQWGLDNSRQFLKEKI